MGASKPIVSLLTKSQSRRYAVTFSLCVTASLLLSSLPVPAQARPQSSSQSSSSSSSVSDDSTSTDVPKAKPAPRIAQLEAGGSAITLETSEPLFYLAVALNICGYDADLAASSPVRRKIREEINVGLQASA